MPNQKISYQLCTVFWTPKLKMVKVYGRASQLMSAMPIVITTVEIMSCFFRAGSISFTAFISKKSVANSVVMRHAIIPTELTSRGYTIGVNSWLIPKDEIEATTRAAHDDSAYEPKRSDPIPAISPTLSPTLSAMTCMYNKGSFLQGYTTGFRCQPIHMERKMQC
jgi:hypothetical protein